MDDDDYDNDDDDDQTLDDEAPANDDSSSGSGGGQSLIALTRPYQPLPRANQHHAHHDLTMSLYQNGHYPPPQPSQLRH